MYIRIVSRLLNLIIRVRFDHVKNKYNTTLSQAVEQK